MGDNYIRLENYEMLKALYDFKATFAKTLSFREHDYFILYQTNTKQRNWWQVVNSNGQVGYIPSNYVTTVKVQPQVLVEFLEECIKKVRSEGGKQGIALEADRQDLLLRLIEKKRQAESNRKTKKQAPVPPDFGSSAPSKESSPRKTHDNSDGDSGSVPSNVSGSTAQSGPRYEGDSNNTQVLDQNRRMSTEDRFRHFPRQCSSEIVQRTQLNVSDTAQKSPSHTVVKQTPSSSPVKSSPVSCDINSATAYQLLDDVRRNTQLSYEMSKVAVTVVVASLQEIFPESVSHYFDLILNQLQSPLNVSKMSIEETYDANRLKVIFNELASCKEDSQQRSWMLYEDESIIVEYIKELTSILTNADANISRYALRIDQYNGVTTLVQYYQMEARWTIRQLLLQSFGVMCSLDPVVLTIMLNSVLPMELARDMQSNPRNVPKLNYSSLLLTMIFSMGEPMPITHLEQLGTDFVVFLLDLIENPPDTDLEDQIPDLFLNLILSYNLQFTNSENIVLTALKERTQAKTFTEKILFLLNREEDPVRIFDHQPAPPHSILKLFVDLFGSESTAQLFYTNDIKVLIDIILRQLVDIFPGTKRRQYLELCRRVLRTSNYDEHRHRSEDLLKCFTRIFCEETSESQEDQQLVREIGNEFPHLFQM
ncbi:NCK-interacting protein with SH3 domain [Orussus abietinus]|uniref:NCK-interacting protein with SH3 domain n=1 Tax=Orussus abietinus TaxID=222816 RepID=UPI0006255DED|nr:NCK-interacting protein with SH3 domain [Orussus abietinus]